MYVRRYMQELINKVMYVLCSILLELNNGDSRVCVWICMFFKLLEN